MQLPLRALDTGVLFMRSISSLYFCGISSGFRLHLSQLLEASLLALLSQLIAHMAGVVHSVKMDKNTNNNFFISYSALFCVYSGLLSEELADAEVLSAALSVASSAAPAVVVSSDVSSLVSFLSP